MLPELGQNGPGFKDQMPKNLAYVKAGSRNLFSNLLTPRKNFARLFSAVLHFIFSSAANNAIKTIELIKNFNSLFSQ